MAKAFSVASWNVEHFKSQGVSSRVEDVVRFLARRDAGASQARAGGEAAENEGAR
jgi:hypothetical protein